METLADRLREVMKELGLKAPGELATFCGVSAGLVTQWFTGQTKLGPKPLKAFARTNFNLDWIVEGRLPKYRNERLPYPSFGLASADQTDDEVGKIEYWEAKGSCGGGFLNHDQAPRGNLIKEASFFQRYKLKPENAFAIYADGNSMADFIIDGDIVIFDRSKTEPRSGKIFAINHPDGLRIKRLRREINGTWVLESNNPDKREYPDERIDADRADLLKILGEFVYRQGGY